ncbi:uncharacterized protein LOC115356335 [Myripristis murdjan]|uniref:uncharacterized protein LOC115356335 n=1 Tax=Myripristis murdjan TaxID=586833 RepID=UPI0011761416|nr:uncharacterized protein LOC115356335 [Myripristis murdjan]
MTRRVNNKKPHLKATKVTLPQVTFPQVMSHQMTFPQVTFHQVRSHQVMFPQVTLPQVTFPKVMFPQVTLPQVTFPQVTLPKVMFPQVMLPQVMLPKVTLPQVMLPKVTLPQVMLPEVMFLEMTFPQITRLALVGGSNSDMMIQRMLSSTVTNSLASIFNWAGKGQKKRAFKDTLMQDCMFVMSQVILSENYADDTQLYLSVKPNETHQLSKLEACLKEIKAWMATNFLLLNSERIEVIMFGPKYLRESVSNDIAILDGITLAPSSTVRNLGVIFDVDLSFTSHIKQISKTAFFHLRNISKLRHILSQNDAEKLIHAFVTSRLDYRNSLLSGCTSKSLKTLQLVQNAAARVLTRTRRRDHITPILASLHWLPVESRVEFKTLFLTYKTLDGQAPSYLKELIVPYHPARALRSQNAGLLVVPKISKTRSGGRSFQFQAPRLWNNLPISVRRADSLSIFKSRLKTFLFDKAYS